MERMLGATFAHETVRVWLGRGRRRLLNRLDGVWRLLPTYRCRHFRGSGVPLHVQFRSPSRGTQSTSSRFSLMRDYFRNLTEAGTIVTGLCWTLEIVPGPLAVDQAAVRCSCSHERISTPGLSIGSIF